MKSKEIFIESERRRLLLIADAGFNEHCKLMRDALSALIIAEQEIEEKNKKLDQCTTVILEFATKQGESYKQLISKDKEIAELKEENIGLYKLCDQREKIMMDQFSRIRGLEEKYEQTDIH